MQISWYRGITVFGIIILLFTVSASPVVNSFEEDSKDRENIKAQKTHFFRMRDRLNKMYLDILQRDHLQIPNLSHPRKSSHSTGEEEPPFGDRTIYVPDDYPTIQEAVNHAQPGDTIIVRDGIYVESVVVNKSHLTIKSENGPENCIVEAFYEFPPVEFSFVFSVYADYTALVGFTITGGDVGIWVDDSSNNIIENNRISNGWFGIGLRFSSNSIIKNNRIVSNHKAGIWVGSSSNNIIKNNKISYNKDGIWVDDSSNNIIMNNSMSHNGCGIELYATSKNNIIKNNRISNNRDGIKLFLYSSNNIIKNNRIASNSEAGIWLYDESSNNIITNNDISDNHCGIRLDDESSNNNITNNSISNNGCGIELWSSSNNNIITNNSISDSEDGIVLQSSSNNIIKNNRISNNGKGIELYDSSNNTITNNSISNNDWVGIWLRFSSNNIIKNNRIASNSEAGIWLVNSSNNIITNNSISNNGYGVDLVNSYNNIFYLNSFVNNTEYNAWDEGRNYWDNGTIGNYWDDYCGRDRNGDGIGDTPYEIPPYGDANVNLDHYPLVRDTQPPFVEIVTPEKNYHYFCFFCRNRKLNHPVRYEGAIIWAIGGFKVKAYAHDNETDIKKVEFYVDDEKEPRKMVKPPEEYEWCWNEMLFFEEHTVRVKVYDLVGNVGVEELKVKVFNIRLPHARTCIT